MWIGKGKGGQTYKAQQTRRKGPNVQKHEAFQKIITTSPGISVIDRKFAHQFSLGFDASFSTNLHPN